MGIQWYKSLQYLWIDMGIQSNFGLDSRMNSEVHNDTAPDSGGGVSAFETMVTEYREGQKETRANKRSAPRVGIR